MWRTKNNFLLQIAPTSNCIFTYAKRATSVRNWTSVRTRSKIFRNLIQCPTTYNQEKKKIHSEDSFLPWYAFFTSASQNLSDSWLRAPLNLRLRSMDSIALTMQFHCLIERNERTNTTKFGLCECGFIYANEEKLLWQTIKWAAETRNEALRWILNSVHSFFFFFYKINELRTDNLDYVRR